MPGGERPGRESIREAETDQRAGGGHDAVQGVQGGPWKNTQRGQPQTRKEGKTPFMESVLIKLALQQSTQRWQRATPGEPRKVAMPHMSRCKACGEPRRLQNRMPGG